MKILVMASTFPSGDLDGSRPRFVYDLAEALTSHADVIVLAPHHPGAAKRERMGSVDVERFRYWLPASAQRLTPNMRQQLAASLLAKLQVVPFFCSEIRSLRRLAKRRAVDVVNAHWIIPQGLCAAVVRGLLGGRFRLVVHVHAGDVYMLSKMPGGRWIARYVLSHTDRLFADGTHVRDTLDELVGYESGAVLQPMGVNRNLFTSSRAGEPPESRAFPEGFILFVGRFVEKKGAVYLIRAFGRLRERGRSGLGLVLVGSGPEEGNLRNEVQALGLGDSVRFVGHRTHDEVVGYLQHCRVSAVPSIVDRKGETEGMPTVVVEAMASGVPVVGSAVDGIPDVIRHGENGWLCRQKDPDDLAEILETALDDSERAEIAKAARDTAEHYDWTRIARRYAVALRT